MEWGFHRLARLAGQFTDPSPRHTKAIISQGREFPVREHFRCHRWWQLLFPVSAQGLPNEVKIELNEKKAQLLRSGVFDSNPMFFNYWFIWHWASECAQLQVGRPGAWSKALLILLAPFAQAKTDPGLCRNTLR